MKLFINVQQSALDNEKVVDRSTWKVDLNTEVTATKKVSDLLVELKTRVDAGSGYDVSNELLISEGKTAKASDKVQSLNLKELVYQFSVTKK